MSSSFERGVPRIKFPRVQGVDASHDVPDYVGRALAEAYPHMKWDHTSAKSLGAEGYWQSTAVQASLTRSPTERLQLGAEGRRDGQRAFASAFLEWDSNELWPEADVVQTVNALLDEVFAKLDA